MIQWKPEDNHPLRYVSNKQSKSLTTHDVVSGNQWTPDWKCMGYSVIFQDSISLPSTDDPLIGEKVAVFKSTK